MEYYTGTDIEKKLKQALSASKSFPLPKMKSKKTTHGERKDG